MHMLENKSLKINIQLKATPQKLSNGKRKEKYKTRNE